MRLLTTIMIGTVLALPAMAQTTHAPAKHQTTRHSSATPRQTVEDKGPFTPEANRAYDGGGTILEGVPGGPPPPASAVLSQRPGQPLPPPMR